MQVTASWKGSPKTCRLFQGQDKVTQKHTADEMNLSWPAATSLIVMVTIGSRSAPTWPADIIFTTAYLEIMTYPNLQCHVMYLLLIYVNLSTKFILWTLVLQLFETMHCINSFWLISLPVLIRWSSKCSDVQVQASFFQLFLMFLSVSKYLNTFSTCLPDYLFLSILRLSSLVHQCTFYCNILVPMLIWNVTFTLQDACCNKAQYFLVSRLFFQINPTLLFCLL